METIFIPMKDSNEVSKEQLDLIIQSYKELDLSSIFKDIEMSSPENAHSPLYVQGFMDVYSICHYIDDIDDGQGIIKFISSLTLLKKNVNNYLKDNRVDMKEYISGYKDSVEMIMPILSLTFKQIRENNLDLVMTDNN